MKRLVLLLLLSVLVLDVKSQNKYIYNDTTLMMKLKLCYFGDSVIYNNFDALELQIPLPECSNGEYHTYKINDVFYIVNPADGAYSGSGGGTVYLYKKTKNEFVLKDEIWGHFDKKNYDLENGFFYYYKTDKSDLTYVDYQYKFKVNTEKERFEIVQKNINTGEKKNIKSLINHKIICHLR